MSMKITDYIIAGLIVGLFVTVIAVAFVSMSSNYSNDDVSEQFAGYDKYNETISQIQNIDTNTSTIREKQGAFDVIGDLFSQGYTAFKLTRNSVSIMDEIGTTAIENSELGDNGGTFKAYFSAIILVIFVIGLLAVILNKEL